MTTTTRLEHDFKSWPPRRRCGTCHGPWTKRPPRGADSDGTLLHAEGCGAASVTCAACGGTGQVDTSPALTLLPVRCACAPAR